MSMESSKFEIFGLKQSEHGISKKEEISLLRRELLKIKEKTKEEVEKNEKSGFFHGLEILNINFEELTDDDMLLYQDLKEFIRKKIPFGEFFKELSLHRLLISQHVADMLEEKHNFDFMKDSRVMFSAWVVNRAMDKYAKRAVEEKKRKNAA